MANISQIRSDLKLLGKKTSQFPTISKIQKNPDVLLHDSSVERLNGRFYQSRIQSVNTPSNVFSSSQYMVPIDFHLTGIQSDVLQNIDLEFNITNGGTATIYPLPCTQWITSYSILQGNNSLETNVDSVVLTLESTLESDAIRMDELSKISLFDSTTGEHNTSGIASGVTQTFYLRFPNTILTNSFFFLSAINQQAPVILRCYLSGGNAMFTTADQTMTLNSISLLASGIKYDSDVRAELMRTHRSGSFVAKSETWNIQKYPLGNSLAASTQIQQLLQGVNGECSSMLFFVRPSTINGSTDFGLNILENNLQIGQVSQLTTKDGSNAITQNLDELIPRVVYPLDLYSGSFRDYYAYLIHFSLQPHLSSSKSSDIGMLELNGSNLLVLTTGSAASSGPYELVVCFRIKSFLTFDKDGNVQTALL